MFAAALAYAAGLAGMAYVDTPFLMHVNSGLLIGLGLAGTSFAIVFAVIGRTVPQERRSTALGIATAAGSFGQFALLPLTHLMISYRDWHFALLGMAGITLLMAPLALAMAGTKAPATPAGAAHQSIGAALREAWASAASTCSSGATSCAASTSRCSPCICLHSSPTPALSRSTA